MQLKLTALISIVFLVLSVFPPYVDHAESLATPYENKVSPLRTEGEFAKAAHVMEEYLVSMREDPETKAWEIAEAERLLGDLERMASLPEAARLELTVAESLGWGFHRDSGRYAEAVRSLEQQLEIRRRILGETHFDVALSLNNLAWMLTMTGNYERAERLCREALSMRKTLLGEEHPYVAISLGRLGSILLARGDYVGAEPLYREALAMRQRLFGVEDTEVAASMNSLAVLLDHQGDYLGAEQLYRESLAIRRSLLGINNRYVARSLSNLASVLLQQQDYEGAEHLYRESLETLRRLEGFESGSHPEIAERLSALAMVFEARGDYASAEGLLREAVEMSSEALGDRHTEVADGLANLAMVLMAQGDYLSAEALLREAIGIRKTFLGEEHPRVIEALYSLGLVLKAGGDLIGAERVLEEALSAYDAARVRVGIGVARATFMSSPAADLAGVKLALGKYEEAWPPTEKALARFLADLLMEADQRQLSPAEVAREDSLRRVLSQLEDEVAVYREAARTNATPSSLKRSEEERLRLVGTEAVWSAFQQEIRNRYPLTEGQTFSLSRVQTNLSQNTAIVGWLDVEGGAVTYESWGYVIRSSGPVVWAKLPGKGKQGHRSDPFRRARSYRNELSTASFLGYTYDEDACELWSERIRPLVGGLAGVENLVVLPSGVMLGVPVETLVDDQGRFVGDLYAVSYAPSATVYTWLIARYGDASPPTRALLVGDPPFTAGQLAVVESEEETESSRLASSGTSSNENALRSDLAGNEVALAGLPRLHGTRREVQQIASMFDQTTILVGALASEQSIVALAESGSLGKFDLIHIATHALVDEELPQRSALVLSQLDLPDPLEAALAGARIYDGLLTAREIVREWRLEADLVTLSACKTGLGREIGGEGYIGFAQAFLQSGARSLLVSLWETHDEATSLLMQRFYQNWMGSQRDKGRGYGDEPMSKAKALREAKHWLRSHADENGVRRFENPYYWATFVLVGDNR